MTFSTDVKDNSNPDQLGDQHMLLRQVMMMDCKATGLAHQAESSHVSDCIHLHICMRET